MISLWFIWLHNPNNPDRETKCEYPDHDLQIIWHIIWVIIDDYWMIIVDDYCGWFFDGYCLFLCYLINICENIQSEYSPNFAFAKLCCLKIPVVGPARPAEVIFDLLDSSLQSFPRACRCWPWESYEREDANLPLPWQFFHFKFKNRSVCLLCVVDMFDGELATAACATCQFEQAGSNSPLLQLQERHCYGQIRSKLKSKRRNEWFQKLNERDDFILVQKIVQRNNLKGLSLRRRSIRKQNHSSSSRQ